MNSSNKYFQQGFNDATSTIQDPYTLPTNYQGPMSFDFTPSGNTKDERQQYINGYESHIRQAYASTGNPIYFFPY